MHPKTHRPVADVALRLWESAVPVLSGRLGKGAVSAVPAIRNAPSAGRRLRHSFREFLYTFGISREELLDLSLASLPTA